MTILSAPTRKKLNQRMKKFERRWMPPQTPTHPNCMFVDVTSRCNIHCFMCWREFDNHNPFGDMSLETFRNLVPLMDYMDTVVLQGSGEPFVNPHFSEMLKLAGERTSGIVFATNGTIMSEKYAEELIANRVKTVMISLDAATRETYEKIRINSKWEHVQKNLEKLIQTKERMGSTLPDISFEFVLMRRNVEELPEFIRMAQRYGVKYVGIRHVWIFGEKTKDETMFLYPELMKEKFAEAEQLGKELGITVDLPPQSPIKIAEAYTIQNIHDERLTRMAESIKVDTSPGRVCHEPWTNYWVTWDGNVYPCCQTIRIMGNVNDTGFWEIWNGLAYRLFREGIRSGNYPQECIGCRNLRKPE